MTKAPPRPFREWAKLFEEAFDRGETQTQLAKRLGARIGTVNSAAQYCRKMGILPPPSRTPSFDTRFRKIRFGQVRPELEARPLEFQEWLRSSVPEGSTVADFLLACATDQYLDETVQNDD